MRVKCTKGYIRTAKEIRLPYVLTYSMSIGSSRRVVETAAEAALAYQEIRKAGGSLIAIADDKGNVVTLDELEALLAPSPTVLVVEDDFSFASWRAPSLKRPATLRWRLMTRIRR